MNDDLSHSPARHPARYLIAALLIGAGIIGGGWFIGQSFSPAPQAVQHATVFPEARALSDFRLVDQAGQAFTREDLTGKWHLLFFGFTHCPDICPATLQQLSVARSRLAADPANELPDIVLISVDPERDQPEILSAYVGHFGKGVAGITGEPEELQKLTKPLGIHYEAIPSGTVGGSYTVNHSTAVLLTNPAAELQAIFSTPHSIDAFVSDLPVIMAMP